jgi:hypothetical protein
MRVGAADGHRHCRASALSSQSSSDFTDEFVEHFTHGCWAPIHDGVRSRNISVGVEALPVENKSGFACELLAERSLGSTIAFTERVDGVDLAKVEGQAFGESVTGQVTKEVLTLQSEEDLGRCGLDKLRKAKQTSFRDGDGTDLPSPIVDVFEDPPMDRAQML